MNDTQPALLQIINTMRSGTMKALLVAFVAWAIGLSGLAEQFPDGFFVNDCFVGHTFRDSRVDFPRCPSNIPFQGAHTRLTQTRRHFIAPHPRAFPN